MKIKKLLSVSVLAMALLGCGKRAPRHIVILPDVSGSIDRESLEQAFKAINKLASRLHRGDKIAIIPILDDAEAEASGRILRFEVPSSRQAYDIDLKDFRFKLTDSFEKLAREAMRHPGNRTDILGSIALAEQEFQSTSSPLERLLVVLSDFIQEDRVMNFRRDDHLLSRVSADKLAIRATNHRNINLRGVQVYLGLLRSGQYRDMTDSRREGIQEFWMKYFALVGSDPKCSADGIGLTEHFRF